MFSNNSINVFNKLPKNDVLYKDKYTLRYGNWPQNKNECIVVTDSEGNLSDFIFYSLGLRDNDELEKIIDDFANEINTTWTADVRNWKYDDVVGRSFKVLSSSKYYTYDEKNKSKLKKDGYVIEKLKPDICFYIPNVKPYSSIVDICKELNVKMLKDQNGDFKHHTTDIIEKCKKC